MFSPTALFIPPPPVSWPLSSGLGRPLPTPLPVGRCLRPPTGTPPRPRAMWTGTVRSHRALCLQDSACGGRGASVSDGLAEQAVGVRAAGSPWASARVHRAASLPWLPQNPQWGRALGETRASWFLWSEDSSFPSIAKQQKPAHPLPLPECWPEVRGVVVGLARLMLGPTVRWGRWGRLRGSRPLSPHLCVLGCRPPCVTRSVGASLPLPTISPLT